MESQWVGRSSIAGGAGKAFRALNNHLGNKTNTIYYSPNNLVNLAIPCGISACEPSRQCWGKAPVDGLEGRSAEGGPERPLQAAAIHRISRFCIINWLLLGFGLPLKHCERWEWWC